MKATPQYSEICDQVDAILDNPDLTDDEKNIQLLNLSQIYPEHRIERAMNDHYIYAPLEIPFMADIFQQD